MSSSIFIWILLAVLLFWAVGAYQRLLRLREQVAQAFAPLASEFGQYVVLVQDSFGHNVDRRAPSAHAGLIGAALQFDLSLIAARTKPLEPLTLAALETARQTLETLWLRVQDEPPDLAGAVLPDDLQQHWQQISLQVDTARFEFNQRVQAYNRAIAQMPACWLAQMMRLQSAQNV